MIFEKVSQIKLEKKIDDLYSHHIHERRKKISLVFKKKTEIVFFPKSGKIAENM
jgi:hypothetical protein